MLQMKVAARILFGIALSVLLGTLCMILVYALPMGSMQKHAQESVRLYEYEEDYSAWATGSEQSKLDNFTDAIMVMNAVHPLEQGAIYSAMMNFRWGTVPESSQTKTFVKAMHHEELSDLPYPRYWHGYLLWLKPLLAATQVQHIRVLNSYGVFLLFVAAMLMVRKKLDASYALAFAFAIMTMNIVTISMSFQNSCVYYIMMVSVLVMLCRNDRLFSGDRYPYFFAAIGICVAFFDFLTYPVASLGIPLMMWYVLNRGQIAERGTLFCVKSMTGLMGAWAMGYVGMWSGKWLVSWLLTGYNTIGEAMHQIGHYAIPHSDSLVSAGWDITWASAVQRNISTMGQGPVRIFFFGLLLYLVYLLVIKRRRILFSWGRLLPYAIVAALPFCWYVACSGHSHIHAFFTYRGLSVAVFAILCFVVGNMGNTDSS